MHRIAVGRSSPVSSSSASGREPLSEYAQGTIRHSSPSASALPATARSASRSGEVRPPRRGRRCAGGRARQVMQALLDAEVVVEDHLAGGRPPGSASPMVTSRPARAIGAQPPSAGPTERRRGRRCAWRPAARRARAPRAGSPSASADQRAARGAVELRAGPPRTSSWFQKSPRLPTRSPTIAVAPPARARAIGSAS